MDRKLYKSKGLVVLGNHGKKWMHQVFPWVEYCKELVKFLIKRLQLKSSMEKRPK